ncbi:MAG: carbohydrate ABC transporter permease [Spirochaetaceae bacterium]|jgi:N-acetylglucosamine transport system permease protein|nr:carbohydrate ABC transporter permease [Spirochaetaceae bacterium]
MEQGQLFRRSSAHRALTNVFARVPMVLYAAVIIVPFLFLLLNSLKTNQEFYNNFWKLPAALRFDNYAAGLEKSNIHNLFVNTLYVVFLGLAVNMLPASMISYVIARTQFKFSGAIYKYFLLGLLTPGIICLIPVFFVTRLMRIYNTREALAIVYAAFEMAFSVFVMTSFFKTLPRELEEAAYIDGAGYFRTFWHIIFPLTRPGLITIGVFNFLEFWNDYLVAMTIVLDDRIKTVSQGVMKLQTANAVRTDWGPLFAVCIMAMVPVVLVYALFQKRLTEGLTAGAVKG